MAILTIENFPDELYAKLANTAKLHRRSINSEAIFLLETSLYERSRNVDAELEKIRKTRESIKGVHLTDDDLDFAKNEGRR